jgi:cytochrome d ubiquinol oxidase subunit I
VGLGLLMLAVSWWGAWTQRGGRPLGGRVLRALSLMTFSGWVAVLAGWYVTEIGRQPWLVYGELRTVEAVADHTAGVMSGTLLAYALLYGFLLAAYIATLRYMSAKPAASRRLAPFGQPQPVADEG